MCDFRSKMRPKINPKIDAKIDAKNDNFLDPQETCLSKGTGSAVYVEAVRLFSFSWILVIFWMAHYNEKTCWYMSLRGAASCCL